MYKCYKGSYWCYSFINNDNHFNLDNLEINDLNDVKHALWDARAKWKDIGSCIGVDEGTLDTMKGKDPGESLSDVLSHWQWRY